MQKEKKRKEKKRKGVERNGKERMEFESCWLGHVSPT